MAFISRKADDRSTPHGRFEIYVSKAENGTANNGADIVEFEFTVRTDIEQTHQGYRFSKTFWKNDGELSDKAIDTICKYANSLGVAEGDQFELDDLVGRSCTLISGTFTPSEGANAGKTYDTIRLVKSEEKPYMVAIQAEPKELDDDDDDLPF